MSEKRFVIREAINGDNIIAVQYEGKEVILNSAVNPEYASEVYADTYSKVLKEYDLVFLFGISDGCTLRKIIEKSSSTITFVVYEPEKRLLQLSDEHFHVRDLMKKKNVFICIEDEANIMFSQLINFYNHKKVKYMVLPNYRLLYSEKEKEIYDKLECIIESTRVTRNTTMVFEKEWKESGMLAMRQTVSSSDIYLLKQEIQKYDISHVPAIIVCAGPSLDKNIVDLRKAKGKAFIIVVDAAMQIMSKHMITPDIGINIDGQVPAYFFQGSNMKDIPMVVSPLSSSILWKDESIKKIMDGSCCKLLGDLDEKLLNRKNAQLASGGSVSQNAFMLAAYLGFETIIYIGQDLSYPGKKLHCEGVDQDSDGYEKLVEEMFFVEDVYGEKVLTDASMNWYMKWFERVLKDWPEMHMIDATEGGAKIAGTEIMTLKQAIYRECKNQIDFKAIINQVPDKYTKEQSEIVFQTLKKEPERLVKVKKELLEVVAIYDELVCLAQSNREETEEFKKLYLKVEKMGRFEDEEPIYGILQYYNLHQIYNEGTDIYERDYTAEELLVNAKKTVLGYIDAIDLYLVDFQRIVLDTL